MLRQFIKNILKPLFRYVGLEITSIENIPKPPPLYGDLEKVVALNRIAVQASYDCPLHQCISVNGFSLSDTGWHPFVEALQDVFSNSGKNQYEGSFLQHYYETWKPHSSRDVFAGFKDAPEVLTSIAPFAVHAPWMAADPKDRQSVMERYIHDENRVAGYDGLTAKSGYGLHGPVSKTKGEIEFRRLINVYKSIEANGYDRTQGDGDITVTGIEYNGDFRFCVMHGQHRIAALSALEFKKVPVKVVRIVRYSEICHWPQVYRGFWTEAQARKLVRHLFAFNSKRWAEKIGLIRR